MNFKNIMVLNCNSIEELIVAITNIYTSEDTDIIKLKDNLKFKLLIEGKDYQDDSTNKKIIYKNIDTTLN